MNAKYFTKEEFACKETGENEIRPELVELLDPLRDLCGFPFVITSGYRSPRHSIEAAKASPGVHSQGIAADILITDSAKRYTILKHAFELGFSGIGVHKTFVHLDIRKTPQVVWLY